MLGAAKPWTYWMAFPLLMSALLALVGFGSLYLKRVVEPKLRALDGVATRVDGCVRGPHRTDREATTVRSSVRCDVGTLSRPIRTPAEWRIKASA